MVPGFQLGFARDGGDSTSVTEDLQGGIIQIAATWYAFTALKEDGQAIIWGSFPANRRMWLLRVSEE